MRPPTVALVSGLVLLGMAEPVHAWQVIPCSSDSSIRESYPGDGPWPIDFGVNLPPGSDGREGAEEAMGWWNDIYGANDVMQVTGSGYEYCSPEPDAGFGVAAFDDGRCADMFNFSWTGAAGVNIKTVSNCLVVSSVVYFNSDLSWTEASFRTVAAHEFGHYVHYNHNWDELSVLGYASAGTPSLTFLTARDHAYLRGIFGDGDIAPPNLHVHRYVQNDVLGLPVVPGSESYSFAPEPTCIGGECLALQEGDSISAIVTAGNTGGTEVNGVEVVLRLGANVIGSYSLDFPPESSSSFELTGTVTSSIEPGPYLLEVAIDPSDVVVEGDGPEAGNIIQYGGFEVVCTPDCSGRECGSNSCDSVCGICDLDEDCDDGSCVEGKDDPEPADPDPSGEAGLQDEGEGQDNGSPFGACGCSTPAGREGSAVWALLLGVAARRRRRPQRERRPPPFGG